MNPLIVIPVYNHAATLPHVVRKASETGLPVLVVDDGSTDLKAEVVNGLGCRFLRLDANRGKGAAILAGASQAQALGHNAIITIDADGQHDPAQAPLLAEKAEEKPGAMVIGCREMTAETAPGSSIFGRSFSNFWVRLECGRELPDTQSGFRLYPVPEILKLPVRSRRYDFEVEIITRAVWAGIPVASVPITVHYPESGSRITHFNRFTDNARLSLLHSRLICRALLPVPHKRIAAPAEPLDTGGINIKKPSVLHPVRLLKRLCLEHSTSFQLAVAAWVGIFLGALPLIAVHTIVIIYICHRLHLNKPAAVAASQLCAPPVLPAVCIEAGYFMRHGTLLTDISWDTLVLQVHQRLWEWFLGSLLIGPVLGLLVGLLTYFFISYLRTLGCKT